MALSEVTAAFLRRFGRQKAFARGTWNLQCQRTASTAAEQRPDELDLEQSGFLTAQDAPEKLVPAYDPAARARGRKRPLPAQRYAFRSPKYYRGPLHPHQPPRPSDPTSREFIPGPFSLPRLRQTYDDTIASDLMTLAYTHFPPGHVPTKKGERLRSWVGDSPYFKRRPLRGPRGGDVLRLLRKPITWNNIPRLEAVTVHSMVKDVARKDSGPLHVAGMVLQSITGVRAQAHAAKHSVAQWGIRRGQHISLTCELKGEQMHHFLSKLIDVVMPKIKDWRGVKGSSGDSSGNIAFGLTSEEVATFPEIEVNLDMYPHKSIPGCHIFIHTSAATDRDARMLLSAMGIPFYGKLIN